MHNIHTNILTHHSATAENAILHSSINVLTEQLSIAERMASESLHGKTQMPVEIHDDSVSYDKKTLRRKETDLLLLQKLRQSQPEESELARVTLEKQDLEAKVEKLAAVLDRQLAVDVAAAVLPPPASPMVAPHRADSGRSPASPRSPRAHSIHSSIKVHAVVSGELDFDHATALLIPLGETSDEQLLAEVAIRQLDLHDKITDSLVKQTYSIGKVLGRGASGQVYEATHKKTGVKYACKVVKKDANMNDAQSMSTEIEIMKRIRHRNVCSMYELYESPQKLWIILELVNGGDLHRFVANSSQFNEVIASRYFKQILKGVHYLHSLGVVHRDLKLDNILLAGSGSGAVVKVADFGLAALVRLDEMGYDIEESAKRKGYRELREMWGTKAFFAPEVVEQNYGPQADVWSLGCVLVSSSHIPCLPNYSIFILLFSRGYPLSFYFSFLLYSLKC